MTGAVNRSLRVLVTALAIEDGAVRPPAVGRVDAYELGFTEVDGDPADDPAVSVLRARAEPLTGDRAGGVPTGPEPIWPTLLTGAGWQAVWPAPRPVVGEVELRGTLLVDLLLGTDAWPTRGRATRVRVVSVTRHAAESRIWRPLPGSHRLREVQAAPRWFDRGMAPPDGRTGGFSAPVPVDPWVQEIGVLLDMDLDDVPPLPLRPALVPGAVGGHGEDLWVADVRLPLLVRLRGGRDGLEVVAEHPWPGGILPAGPRVLGRTLHADAGGCWLTGPDGTHRCDLDEPVHRVDDVPVWLAAASDGTLATVALLDPGDPRSRTALRLHTRDGAVTEVPAAADRVAALVEVPDGFLLALGGDDLQLAHLDRAGGLVEGPPVTGVRHVVGLVGGAHPALRGPEAALRPVGTDLRLQGPMPGRVLRGWAVDDRSWWWTHPPDDWDRTGADPTGDRQRWLLTEVDATTGEPQGSVVVTGHPEHVTVVAGRAVWSSAGAVQRWPVRGAVPEQVDVAAALARSRRPADR